MSIISVVGEGSEVDASVLFDQLLLADLQETMSRLDNRVFAEMRSYIEPPELVLKIIQALLNILRPDGDYDNWKQCKKVIAWRSQISRAKNMNISLYLISLGMILVIIVYNYRQ